MWHIKQTEIDSKKRHLISIDKNVVGLKWRIHFKCGTLQYVYYTVYTIFFIMWIEILDRVQFLLNLKILSIYIWDLIIHKIVLVHMKVKPT